MSIPDFERAEYTQPTAIEGEVIGAPIRRSASALPVAVLYGAVAAVIGCAGYTVIGYSGIMVSIVAIGVGWLVAKAMMTGSRGVGGREYQVVAGVLTYLAVSGAELFDSLHYSGLPLSALSQFPMGWIARQVIAGPILALKNPFNGALGLLILFFGLRTAWRIAAGGPGFGQPGRTRQADPFGLR
jgi:hypothetical protein